MGHGTVVVALGGEDFSCRSGERYSAQGLCAARQNRSEPQVACLLLQVHPASRAHIEHARRVTAARRQSLALGTDVDAQRRSVGQGDAPSQGRTACHALGQQTDITA